MKSARIFDTFNFVFILIRLVIKILAFNFVFSIFRCIFECCMLFNGLRAFDFLLAAVAAEMAPARGG